MLNRQNNSFLFNNLKIKNATFYDASNEKLLKKRFKDEIIKPAKLFEKPVQKINIINGEQVKSGFHTIAEGTVVGRLKEMDYSSIVNYRGEEPLIAVLSEEKNKNSLFFNINDTNFNLPMNIKGILLQGDENSSGLNDALGHVVSRLRGRKILAIIDEKTMNKIKEKHYDNQEKPYTRICLGTESLVTKGLKSSPKIKERPISIPENKYVEEILSPGEKMFTPATVGLKAYNLGELQKIQDDGGFKVPPFFVIPSGVWNIIKNAPENNSVYGENTHDMDKVGDYHFFTKKADRMINPENELNILRDMVTNRIVIPEKIRKDIMFYVDEFFDKKEVFDKEKRGGCLIARSSFNGEDSDIMATQGLYDSFPGIRSYEDLYRGIKEVAASKWSELAYMSRRNHKIPHSDIQPNIIVQKVVPVDYTFTINTADPRSNDTNKMVIQLSQGTYSGFVGSPYIFEYDKTTGEIERTAFAKKGRMKNIQKTLMDDVSNNSWERTDYSKDPLNLTKKDYEPIMKKIFDVAKFIEDNFDGKPQDIEGGVIFKENPNTGKTGPEIHIWQTRNVHLIKR